MLALTVCLVKASVDTPLLSSKLRWLSTLPCVLYSLFSVLCAAHSARVCYY